jgi:hypothetical protein
MNYKLSPRRRRRRRFVPGRATALHWSGQPPCTGAGDRPALERAAALHWSGRPLCTGIAGSSALLRFSVWNINYKHRDTENTEASPLPPRKGGESAAAERSSSSVASGQTLSLHEEHGENTPFRRCALPALAGRQGRGLRVLRVSVFIIYSLCSYTGPSRAKFILCTAWFCVWMKNSKIQSFKDSRVSGGNDCWGQCTKPRRVKYTL